MKLTDFINSSATKAGKQNEQAIIDILARADLQNIDIADETANAIVNSLMTIDVAKNNSVLKNHFFAQALNGFDTEIINAVKTFGLDDSVLTELSAIKNTNEKYRKFSEKLKELTDNLKASQVKGDDKAIEKYTKQINDLNAKISQFNETHVPKTELDKIKKESDNAVLDFMLQSKLAGLNYANKDMTADTNAKLAKIILNEALAKSEAILINENNAIKLKQAKEPTLDYIDQTSKAVAIDDFMNKTFADAKILAVSNGGPQPPQYTPQYAPPANGGANTPGLAEFQAQVQQQVNSLT